MNIEQKLLVDYSYLRKDQEQAFQRAIRFPFRRKPEMFLRPNERLIEPFTIGVPKSKGEFNGGILRWAQQYGFDYRDGGTRRLSFINPNGSKMFLMRTPDIMKRLSTGELAYGLVGAEKIVEYEGYNTPYIPVQPLCFGASMFCLGFRNNEYPYIQDPDEMRKFLQAQMNSGRQIATSLPKTLLRALRFKTPLYMNQPYLLDGSVEAALDLAPENVFAAVDIVESGETGLANGIRADYRLLELPGAFIVRFDYEERQKQLQWDEEWREVR